MRWEKGGGISLGEERIYREKEEQQREDRKPWWEAMGRGERWGGKGYRRFKQFFSL